MIPQQLYQFLTAKDSSSGRLEVVSERFRIGQGAAVTVNSPALFVPIDRVFSLDSVFANGIAGAAQLCTTVRVVMIDRQLNELHTLYRVRDAGAAILDTDRQCEIWVPPNYGLMAIGTFDAGAAINFTSITCSGVLFPRANVQLGSLEVV